MRTHSPERSFLLGLVLYPLAFTGFLFALPTPRVKKAAAFGDGGPRFAIEHVRVFDGVVKLEDQTVLVENGRVAAVGKGVRAPKGAPVFDGAGRTLLPGLVDAHTHVFFDAAKDALAFGVTTELDMGTHANLLPGFKKKREDLSNATEADVFSAGFLATAPKGHGTEYGLPVPTLTKPEEADAWVEARLAEGSDYIKLVYDDGSAWGLSFPTLDRATLGAVVRAAHVRKKLAVVHIGRRRDARAAIEEGVDGLVHVFADERADDAFLKLAKERGIFVIPTLAVMESLSGSTGKVLADPDLSPFLGSTHRQTLGASFPFSKKGSAAFETALANVRLLKAAGVPILAGTDAPNPGTAHGASVHREMELLVSAGLTPLEALRAATSLPVEKFGVPERGRVAKGMRADLVIVDGDPTENITRTRRIDAIYENGRFVARERFDPNAHSAPAMKEGVLGDFEDGTTKGGFGSGWSETSDKMRGGTSVAALSVVDGGAHGSKKALRVEGEIRAGFPFPWAGAIFMPGTPPFSPVDASTRRELVFFARGDGRTYRVMVFTQATQIPVERTFAAKDAWSEVRVPLSEFANADWKSLQAVGFSAGADPGAFRLEVDQVELR